MPRVGFVSLGCAKALVDSERILTQLRSQGYELVGGYQDADLVVVNTCGFIDSAIEESFEAIEEALRENGRVIVTGCLGSEARRVREAWPDVLAVTGPAAFEEVMAAVHQALPPPPHDPRLSLTPDTGLKLTPRHYAYLKISEGCNHRCTFCIIPDLRGPLVSRPIGEVLDEAQALVEAGCRELLVISQDTSAYGVDLRYRTGFHRGRPVQARFVPLVRELSRLDAWVRLHYVYPYPHVDDLLPLMAGFDGERGVVPYLDVPMQHAHPRILAAMKRPAGGERLLRRIERWRAECPEICIRSTFIVGFPSESEQEFEVLLDFLREARLDRVGAFAYSPVAGARANAIAGLPSERERQARLAALMAVQAEISAERLADLIGTEQTVIIDETDENGAIGRLCSQAPEVDGVVHLTGPCAAIAGQRTRIEITHSDDHDLYGREVGAGFW